MNQSALKSRDGLVTMAFYPGQESILSPSIFPHVDAFHMMSYDQHDKHSTMDFMIKVTTDALKKLPRDKLTIGVPFYARHTRTGEAKTYQEILQMNPKLKPNSDQEGPYYYNGFQTIKKKVEYAMKNGIGGIMIWEVGQDIHPSNGFSLLRAITEARNEETHLKKNSDDEL